MLLLTRPLYFIIEGVNCTADEPLLNGATPVPNSYFTASSEIDLTHAAHLSRLDGTDKRWTPTEADRDLIPPTLFLQVSQEYKK